GPEEMLLKLVLLAYPDRVARRREAGKAGATMVGGGGVRLSRQCVVHDWKFFVASDARHDDRNPAKEALVRMASGIRTAWLEELFPQSIRRVREAEFDEKRGRVTGRLRTYYLDLVLLDEATDIDADLAERTLRAVLLPRAPELVLQEPALASLMARIR